MRRFAVLLLGAAVLVAALLWHAPATLVSARLDALAGGRVVLADARGTVWDGRGTLVAGPDRLPVAWHLHPRPLLHGEVVITLHPHAAAGAPEGEVHVNSAGTAVRDLRVSLPASAVAGLWTGRPRVDAAGTLEVRAPAFAWPPSSASGTLAATWHGARLGLAGGPLLDLGAITASLRAAQGNATGPVQNSGGDFALDGEVVVHADGGGTLRGVVRARDPADPRLAALRALGPAEGDGVRVEWRWRGQ